MAYHYEPGAKRWKRHTGNGDVRCQAPAKGWVRRAYQLEAHPVTYKPLRQVQWWFLDTYTGEKS